MKIQVQILNNCWYDKSTKEYLGIKIEDTSIDENHIHLTKQGIDSIISIDNLTNKVAIHCESENQFEIAKQIHDVGLDWDDLLITEGDEKSRAVYVSINTNEIFTGYGKEDEYTEYLILSLNEYLKTNGLYINGLGTLSVNKSTDRTKREYIPIKNKRGK